MCTALWVLPDCVKIPIRTMHRVLLASHVYGSGIGRVRQKLMKNKEESCRTLFWQVSARIVSSFLENQDRLRPPNTTLPGARNRHRRERAWCDRGGSLSELPQESAAILRRLGSMAACATGVSAPVPI